MTQHDLIKIIRDEEKEKMPPPYRLEVSTPTQINQADRICVPRTRECKVYYADDLIPYSRIINQRVRDRFKELGLDLTIEIDQYDLIYKTNE